jgi:epoxyqueuosine reductase
MNGLTARLKHKARELGFSMVGIVPAFPARRLSAYLQWINNEYHGKMGYLARPDRLVRRQDLHVILPNVQSLVCVGLDYKTLELPPNIANDPNRGRISNYAWGVDYHDLMTPRLQALGAWLEQEQGQSGVVSKVYVDTGAVLERDHAEGAGLGFTGKNTMLIAPQRGSWFFLGELLTTAKLIPDAMKPTLPSCGKCTRCLTACPTHAFPEPYVLDARRCISYLTIELKGWIPRDLRPLMGNWLYGCDVCQVVCPFNRFAPVTSEADFRPPNFEVAAPPLLEILNLTEAGFRERFLGSPIKRIKRRGLLRNACVNAGNSRNPIYIPTLTQLLHDPEPLLRGHAAWALGQIGTPSSLQALSHKLPSETDPEVQEEIQLALAGSPARF